MCPVCLATAVAMTAGAGLTGGALAVCVAKFRKLFKARGLSSFQRIKEK
jgi:hypothetical protein